MKKNMIVVCIGVDLGGIEKSLINFLKNIDKEKYNVDLLLWSKDGELYNQVDKMVKVMDASQYGLVTMNKLYEIPNMLNKIKCLIRYFRYKVNMITIKKPWLVFKEQSKEYDIAIAYSQNDYSPYYVIDKMNSKKKYMWFHNGVYNVKKHWYELDKNYYGKMDRIVAVSDSCKDELISKFPSIKDKIIVIKNIINRDDIIQQSNEEVDIRIDEAEIKIVTVGRIADDKGTDIAIEIAKILRNGGCIFKWYFVGSGSLYSEIENRIKTYNLSEYCILLGAKSNPYPYIRMADIYVQPSRIESFGLTIAEAKVLCKPIIATDLPAIREQLYNGKLGILSDRTPESFAVKILQLIADRNYRKILIETLKTDNENQLEFTDANPLLM